MLEAALVAGSETFITAGSETFIAAGSENLTCVVDAIAATDAEEIAGAVALVAVAVVSIKTGVMGEITIEGMTVPRTVSASLPEDDERSEDASATVDAIVDAPTDGAVGAAAAAASAAAAEDKIVLGLGCFESSVGAASPTEPRIGRRRDADADACEIFGVEVTNEADLTRDDDDDDDEITVGDDEIAAEERDVETPAGCGRRVGDDEASSDGVAEG